MEASEADKTAPDALGTREVSDADRIAAEKEKEAANAAFKGRKHGTLGKAGLTLLCLGRTSVCVFCFARS